MFEHRIKIIFFVRGILSWKCATDEKVIWDLVFRLIKFYDRQFFGLRLQFVDYLNTVSRLLRPLLILRLFYLAATVLRNFQRPLKHSQASCILLTVLNGRKGSTSWTRFNICTCFYNMTTHNVKMPVTKQSHVEGGTLRVCVCMRVYIRMARVCVYVHECIVHRT